MKKMKAVLGVLLSMSLLIGGFSIGFASSPLLAEEDVLSLELKSVLAADADYEPSVRLWDYIAVNETESSETVSVPAASVDLSQPRVMIYCTHNAECYRPSDGADKKEGQNGGIFKVATVLYEQLVACGVSAVLCPAIHDYPDWSSSYANSLASINAMREQYPSLEVFIDVHRDAPSVEINSTVKNGGAEYAKIMLVVGSAQRIEHPTWEKNHAFAQEIGNALNEKCSGILRGVKVQNGRYNQHVSQKSILVEMGTNLNTAEQAKNSAAILAETLSELLL